MTEERSIGYEEGYQAGWNAAMDAIPDQPAQQEPVACEEEHPNSRYLFKRLCGVAGIELGKDTVPQALGKIAKLREALAEQPAQQEPFGYLYQGTAEHTRHKTVFQKTRTERLETRWWKEIGPCYTSSPAQRTWVGLSEKEKSEITYITERDDRDLVMTLTEAKLKEKNT